MAQARSVERRQRVGVEAEPLFLEGRWAKPKERLAQHMKLHRLRFGPNEIRPCGFAFMVYIQRAHRKGRRKYDVALSG